MVKAIGQSRNGRDADTEQRILDAAHTVFLRRGTAGARMQEIADEADVNKALLHYYFRSKSRLAEAVFQRIAVELFPNVIQLLGSDTPIREKVERVVALELDLLSRSPFVPAYLISEMSQQPERVQQFLGAAIGQTVDGIGSRIFGKLDRQLKDEARAGTMRPIAVEQFVVNLISLCIFPFAARPLISAFLRLDDRAFKRFIARRKRELPAFFLAALRP